MGIRLVIFMCEMGEEMGGLFWFEIEIVESWVFRMWKVEIKYSVMLIIGSSIIGMEEEVWRRKKVDWG